METWRRGVGEWGSGREKVWRKGGRGRTGNGGRDGSSKVGGPGVRRSCGPLLLVETRGGGYPALQSIIR